MCAGEAIPVRAEHDKHPNALAPRNERNCAIRSHPLFHIVFFDLKLDLSFEIASHEWLLILKHPPMVACFRVQY